MCVQDLAPLQKKTASKTLKRHLQPHDSNAAKAMLKTRKKISISSDTIIFRNFWKRILERQLYRVAKMHRMP